MRKKDGLLLRFTPGVILLFAILCLPACGQNGHQSENRAEETIQAMIDHEVFIKYVSSGDNVYYQLIASDELIHQLDLWSWELEETDHTLDFEEYLVVRLAEKYEIVIDSNQVGKIYDYYGTYGTRDPEALFYHTALKLQTIVDFLDQYAEHCPNCNIGFEN